MKNQNKRKRRKPRLKKCPEKEQHWIVKRHEGLPNPSIRLLSDVLTKKPTPEECANMLTLKGYTEGLHTVVLYRTRPRHKKIKKFYVLLYPLLHPQDSWYDLSKRAVGTVHKKEIKGEDAEES